MTEGQRQTLFQFSLKCLFIFLINNSYNLITDGQPLLRNAGKINLDLGQEITNITKKTKLNIAMH